MSKVFIAFQRNEDTRPIIEAVLADNAHAEAIESPAMVKIDAPGRLVVKRASVEELTGMEWDLQSLHVNLISLSGNLDETEDELVLAWKS